MTTARHIAEQITDSYTDATQFEAVSSNGCGEWEHDTAAELIGAADISVDEVCDAIVEICKSRLITEN